MQRSVLLVDDSMVSRLMLRSIIDAEMPGSNVLEASCGDEALDKVKSLEKLDIALVDYNMPGIDGLQLFEQLANLIDIPKRALLTANIQDHIRRKTESHGITFLSKPIVEDTIRAFIEG